MIAPARSEVLREVKVNRAFYLLEVIRSSCCEIVVFFCGELWINRVVVQQLHVLICLVQKLVLDCYNTTLILKNIFSLQ